MKIMFCLPGREFSDSFLKSWSSTLFFCMKNDIQPIISINYDPNIYYVRNKCLGADVTRGPNQKPYNGQVEYDYIMWIDSDVVFNPEQIQRLINHDKDIVAGLYMMSDQKHFAVVKDWNEEYFKANGCFQFLTHADIKDAKEPFDVAYSGFGFILIKKGVFESMEYPWFSPINHKIGDCQDFSSEDVSFCLKAKDKGYKIFIDPTIIVGHEKKFII